jgi:phosphohistidine swiveling domain-containing protein
MTLSSTARDVIPLIELTRADRNRAGGKAATLGELAAHGFPVPHGFVVTSEPDADEILTAAAALGDVPLAVRSSAVAEDLAEASFAGQYESFLNVRGAKELLEAIRLCQQSALSVRVQQYRAEHVDRPVQRMAVLVQRMVAADAAGVAFTADPVTGERGQVVITAARGLGERVVAGEAVGDEWVVADGKATCRRRNESAIDAIQAAAIASLARRVEAHLGSPQDIEWASASGELYLLQARPMTALPEPVEWRPPFAGYWMRNLRLGEWLPEPMTPLFQHWLLERLDEGLLDGMYTMTRARLPWPRAAINGWYYTAAPTFSLTELGELARAAIASRGRIFSFVFDVLIRVGTNPEVTDQRVLRRLAEEWRSELLPRYQTLVAESERRLETATPAELGATIDAIGRLAGEYLWSLFVVGGSAWKMEGCLASFLNRYLPGRIDSVQVLLRGLPGADLEVPAHSVQSLDWYWPTSGELDVPDANGDLAQRRRQLAAEREATETACRSALAGRAALHARFDTLLAVAQRYAVIREEQARWLTLGWPLLRRCALRLGEHSRARGAIARSDDVFFLTRGELARDVQSPTLERGRQAAVAERRAEWERQRRLVAPLAIGKPPRLLEKALQTTLDAVRRPNQSGAGILVGQPASPGRATGPVRIVRCPEDFPRFQIGDVLVARGTAPAWTPLFARAAAVVTDTGSLAAHASLVAREYGIPAVVGTGDATARLRDGQRVVVDGGAGTVEIA